MAPDDGTQPEKWSSEKAARTCWEVAPRSPAKAPFLSTSSQAYLEGSDPCGTDWGMFRMRHFEELIKRRTQWFGVDGEDFMELRGLNIAGKTGKNF